MSINSHPTVAANNKSRHLLERREGISTSFEAVHTMAVYSLQPKKQITWVDQKVLKLLAYLFEFTTEIYKTYTEYKANIS